MSMLTGGTIDSVALAIAAVASVVGGIVQWIRSIVTTKKVDVVSQKTDAQNETLDSIQAMVNGRLSLALARIEQLTVILGQNGIQIPDSTVFRTAMHLAKIPAELISALEVYERAVKTSEPVTHEATPTEGRV